MRTIEGIVKMMNDLLHADLTDDRQIRELFGELKRCNASIRFLDFEYYNEITLRWAKQGKVEAVKSKKFETAAEYRDIEKKCQDCVETINCYKLRESAFQVEEGNILYFYRGNARNDKIFKKHLDRQFSRLANDMYR